jgi:hypothetical protein
MSLDEKFTEHRTRVTALRDGADIAPPPQWTQLDERLTHYLALASGTLDKLKAAVASGSADADLVELRARALAETGALPTTIGQLNTEVSAHIYEGMLAAYNKCAKTNYTKVSSQFDAAARDFVSAANVVNPETPADQLVTADEPLRRAWSDALVHAARLDHTSDMLCHAAELCGVNVGWQPFDGGRLALVADPAATSRADLFKAWTTTTGRAGRWAALLKAGATIRAATLEDFAPYHPDDDKPKTVEPIDPRRHPPSRMIAT